MNAKLNNLDALLDEKRQFRASAEFRKRAVVRDRGIYDKAKDDRLNFWESWAETLKWNEMWEDVTDHEMFSSPRFIAFKEKHGRTFISPLKRNNKKKS